MKMVNGFIFGFIVLLIFFAMIPTSIDNISDAVQAIFGFMTACTIVILISIKEGNKK